MGEICPKTKSYPPLIKQELISTPPHIMIILRLTPPPPLKKSLLPSIPSYPVYLLDFFRWYKHHFKWLFDVCRSVIRMDSELVSSSHEMGDSSSSAASLALRFPRTWVRTQEFLSDWAFFFLKLNLIIRVLGCLRIQAYCYKNFNSWVFHVLLNYDAMCANIGIFLFHWITL